MEGNFLRYDLFCFQEKHDDEIHCHKEVQDLIRSIILMTSRAQSRNLKLIEKVKTVCFQSACCNRPSNRIIFNVDSPGVYSAMEKTRGVSKHRSLSPTFLPTLTPPPPNRCTRWVGNFKHFMSC